ncbi:MAG: heme exporter protein CcmD [Pseudomonadota bacterium]
MPDLGSYASEVTLAYAGSLVLLAGIIALSWAQSRRSKRLLEESEGRRDG